MAGPGSNTTDDALNRPVLTALAGAAAAIAFTTLFAPLLQYAFEIIGWPIGDTALLGLAGLFGGLFQLLYHWGHVL